MCNPRIVYQMALRVGASYEATCVALQTHKIIDDGTAKKKEVTVGISTKEKTQILEGLSETDTVITGGGFGMDDGTKVKVVAAAEGDDDDKGTADDGKAADDKPSAGTPADDKAGDNSDTKGDDKK